jgi:hypothetical protein
MTVLYEAESVTCLWGGLARAKMRRGVMSHLWVLGPCLPVEADPPLAAAVALQRGRGAPRWCTLPSPSTHTLRAAAA